MTTKNKKYKQKIIILGNSNKFIKIIKSLYKSSSIQIYPWRLIPNYNLKKKKLFKTPEKIFICGYDYQSQRYSYEKFYNSNVTMPLNFTKFLSNKKTRIIYIDTLDKISNKQRKKNYTFSRYEFAKKELAFKLNKNFENLEILKTPPIVEKDKVLIHGEFLTKFIFKFLIRLSLIKTIDIKDLKKKIIQSNFKKKKEKRKLNPVLLNIPRTLFLDRLVRILLD